MINTTEEADKIISIELENDELVKLVTSNADVASQYVIFQNSNDEYFAINVAKVEELVEYKTLDITNVTDKSSIIIGTSKIREHFVNIICFDTWLNVPRKEASEYELAILCDYGGKRLSFIVKKVYGVLNIEPSEMYDDSDKDKKVSYITEILVNSKKVLCKIFDTDQFLADALPTRLERELDKSKSINELDSKGITKKILIAEDSVLIQNAIHSLMDKMQLSYEIFKNGKELIDALSATNINNIALIITDLEMPVMGGLELIEICAKDDKFKSIPIVVNTNMANNSIKHIADKFGVKRVIEKLDLLTLKEVILEFSIRD